MDTTLNTHLPMRLRDINLHKKTKLNILIDKISIYTRKVSWNLLRAKYYCWIQIKTLACASI